MFEREKLLLRTIEMPLWKFVAVCICKYRILHTFDKGARRKMNSVRGVLTY